MGHRAGGIVRDPVPGDHGAGSEVGAVPQGPLRPGRWKDQVKITPAGYLPEGSPLEGAARPTWPSSAPRNAEGLLAACVVVLSSALIPKLLVPPSTPSEDHLRTCLPVWAVISVLALACRRRLAPWLGPGRLEAWAAAFAGVFVTVAASDLYYVHILRAGLPPPGSTRGPAELWPFCLAIGLYEELGFRGVVLEGLRDRKSTRLN